MRFATLLALCGALAIATTAGAQDGTHGQGHAENHDWYQQLKQPGTGYSCCNGTRNGVEGDCRPTRAYIDEETGKWKAMINGQYVTVPPHLVLPPAPDGNSHICAGKRGMIYCFMPGSPKS